MPITKSAKKAAKQSEKRRLTNSKFKVKLKNTLKVTKKAIIAKEGDNAKLISEAYSVIDKAAKKNLLHKKSAARKKASIMKMTKAQ